MLTKAQIDRLQVKLHLLSDEHLPRKRGVAALKLCAFIKFGLAFVALMSWMDRYDRARGGEWLV